MTLTLQEKYDALGGAVSYRELAGGRFREAFTDSMTKGGGLSRLSRWARAGCPEGPFDVCYTGDESIRPRVTAVARRLPAPVAYHLARNVYVVAIGWLGGLCSAMPAFPPGDELRQLIAVNHNGNTDNDDTLEATIAHEVAHSWTNDVLEPDEAESSTQRAYFVRLLAAEAWRARRSTTVTQVIQRLERREVWAATLAKEWGFTGPATDPQHAVAGVMRMLRTCR